MFLIASSSHTSGRPVPCSCGHVNQTAVCSAIIAAVQRAMLLEHHVSLGTTITNHNLSQHSRIPPQLEPQSKRKPAEVDVSLPKQPLWGLPEPSLPGAQLSVCDGARSVDVLSRPRPPSLHLCLPKSPDCTPVTIQSPRSHSPLIWRSTNSALFLKRRLTNPTHTYHRPAALFSLPDVSASSFFGQDLQWSSKA